MRIVIDSNILFSALIKDAQTRKLILEHKDYFLFPLFIFEELEKHKEELQQKAKMTSADFNQLLSLLLSKMELISEEKLEPYINDALSIVKEIDENDMLFFASVLAHPESALWSEDKHLKKQTKIRIINTAEFIKYFAKEFTTKQHKL